MIKFIIVLYTFSILTTTFARAADNDNIPLRIFASGKNSDISKRVKLILKNAFRIDKQEFHYDSLSTNVHDIAFDKVIKNLVPLKRTFVKLEIAAKARMLGFEDILKQHEFETTYIENSLQEIQGAFFQFLSITSRDLFVSGNGSTVKRADGVCEWLSVTPVPQKIYDEFMKLYTRSINYEYLMNHFYWEFSHLEPEKYTEKLCELGHSPVDYFYGLFTRMALALWKHYIVRYVHNYFVEEYAQLGTQCISQEMQSQARVNKDRIDELSERILNIERAFSHVWATKNAIRNCDPIKLIRDNNFIELEGAFQTVVLPPTHIRSDTCNRDGYLFPVNLQGKSYWNDFCDRDFSCAFIPRPCLGRIYNCESAVRDVKHPLTLCLFETGPRRYKFINYWDGRKYIDGGTCSDGTLQKIETRSNARSCLCTCNDNAVDSKSTHIVNLMPVESDYQDNKVVTGAKFLVISGVLHIQIEQGTLSESLLITDREWKPVDDISERVRVSRMNPSMKGKLIPDKDYFILSKDTRDKFDLGRLSVYYNETITGIYFTYWNSRLKLKVTARKFDPLTGIICQECPVKFYYFTRPNTEHEDFSGDFPLKQQTLFTVVDNRNSYVKFHESSLVNDFGQTTLPYFDAEPVVTEPPMPIGGVSTILKKSTEGIGIIALQLHSYNYMLSIRYL